MNVGLAVYNFNPKKGGAERYAYDLSTKLAQRGHRVFVFCANGIPAAGVDLIPLRIIPYPRWLRSFAFAMNHKKVARYFPIDVILGFGNTIELDVFQSHGGVHSVWMEREIASYENRSERRYKAFMLRTSLNQWMQKVIQEFPVRTGRYKRIVAISDMVRGHMSANYAIDKQKIDIVYNGVDTERFRPVNESPDGKLRILFSAGNFRLKGLGPLLRALRELSTSTDDFHLSIMGRGRRARYKQMIDGFGLGGLVSFLGEQAQPERLYGQHHVLAHPTFYDACSLTTMEGMACGLPVITTRWNGSSALIGENEGFVVDEPDDTNAIVTILKSLMNPGVRGLIGKKASMKLAEYTMERNVASMERVLLEACGQANGR